jgi:hypothetical protein
MDVDDTAVMNNSMMTNDASLVVVDGQPCVAPRESTRHLSVTPRTNSHQSCKDDF